MQFGHMFARTPVRQAVTGDALRLIEGETQDRIVEHRHAVIEARPRQAGRWFPAAHCYDMTALGQHLQCHAQRFVQPGLRRNILVVVEHEGEGRFEAGIEVGEELTRVTIQVGEAVGRTDGQRTAMTRDGLFRGESEVVEEGGDIRVAGVRLVPECGHAPALEIIGHQHGLARTGWAHDPDERFAARTIQ